MPEDLVQIAFSDAFVQGFPWSRYVREWSRWNDVCTAAALAASASRSPGSASPLRISCLSWKADASEREGENAGPLI